MQTTPGKRQRRQRGSINPEDIISGAFELAQQVSIDNLSMPLLGKHLGVGVTSIYWYFRKKDDLLNAMTDRALSKYVFATPYIEAGDWRETLRNHARSMRKTFADNPVLCDLILIRAALSPKTARLGAQEMEKAIANLVTAGLSLEDAFDIYSAVSVHVRGSVVLDRLSRKSQSAGSGPSAIEHPVAIDPATTPLLAHATGRGHRIGAPDETNFEYGLECILDHAGRLIEQSSKAAGEVAVRSGCGGKPDSRVRRCSAVGQSAPQRAHQWGQGMVGHRAGAQAAAVSRRRKTCSGPTGSHCEQRDGGDDRPGLPACRRPPRRSRGASRRRPGSCERRGGGAGGAAAGV